MRQAISDPLAAINTGAYSPALRIGPWIFVSGQGPLRADGSVIEGDVATQTRATLENIRRLIEAAGGRMEDVARCSVYLQSMEDFEQFDREYRRAFNEPLPTRTTVEAGLDNILVEIDAIAFVDERK